MNCSQYRRWILASLILLSSTSCGRVNQNAPHALGPHARLEVYEVSRTQVPNSLAETDPSNGSKIYLLLPPIITSEEVATVQRTVDGPGMPAMKVEMTPAGSAKLSAATSSSPRKEIALVVNGTVISALTPRETLSQGFILSGDTMRKDHEKIFEALKR